MKKTISPPIKSGMPAFEKLAKVQPDIILEIIHESLLVLDGELRVLVANPVFYNKFHVTKEETEGCRLPELGNGQWNIPLLLTLLESLFAESLNFTNYKITHVFPGIGEKTMLLNAKRIAQKTTGESFIVLAIADLTDYMALEKEKNDLQDETGELHHIKQTLRQKNDELERMNKELEKTNKELHSFAYVASHDLQEPLRIVRSFSNLILQKEREKLSETGKDYFMRIEHAIVRMQRLIDDLLIYSRTSTAERKFEKTDLNTLLEDAKKLFKKDIHESNAVIEADGLCEVTVIPFQFAQLFQNLLSNALKFTKPGQPPHIRIKNEIAKGSQLQNEQLSPETEYCHISMQDNGIGFDPRFSERIFEVFQRLHGKGKYSGTGVGLAIVKKIVENHGGVITATGEPDNGARFDVYIPLKN